MTGAELEEDLRLATARADTIGAGLRVEHYLDISVVIVTDTVPVGTIETERHDEESPSFYRAKELP